ncbi:MAG: BON domain-containing protein [Bryobacteraceae bacterium]|jgi:osmotically-inducible protein OsmY
MKHKLFVSFFAILALAVGARAAEKHVTDDEIYNAVIRKLASDAVVKGGALKVEVHDGDVTISGKVETDQQKTKAEKLVHKISGVKKVSNELEVVGKGNR